MSFSIANAILRGAWLMDPLIARSYMPMLIGVLKGQTQFEPLSDEERAAIQPYDLIMQAGPASISAGANTTTDERIIRVIPIKGIIMKETEMCGPIGSLDRANMLKLAANDDKVAAVVMKFDTPGGMVAGTQTLADAIRDFPKPIIAFIEDGICASAGYWLASQCDEIISSHETNTVGSIGVYISLADVNGYLKGEGLIVHEIYADQSSEKNKGYREAMKGNYKAIKQGSLNPIADKFISVVKENRNGKLNMTEADPFKGDTYMSDRALKIGLIDSIGSFQDAIDRAVVLSNKTPQASVESGNLAIHIEAPNPITIIHEKNIDMKVKILSKQKHLAAVLGVTFAEGQTEAEVELTPENLQALEGNMEITATNLATANTNLETANAEVTRLGKQAGTMGEQPKVAIASEGPKLEDSDSGFATAADASVASLIEDVYGKEKN